MQQYSENIHWRNVITHSEFIRFQGRLLRKTVPLLVRHYRLLSLFNLPSDSVGGFARLNRASGRLFESKALLGAGLWYFSMGVISGGIFLGVVGGACVIPDIFLFYRNKLSVEFPSVEVE